MSKATSEQRMQSTLGWLWLGNGGQISLQVGDEGDDNVYHHCYDNAAQAADDIAELLAGNGPLAADWEGNEPEGAFDPEDEDLRMNGNHIVRIGGSDSAAQLAEEIAATGGGAAIDLAGALASKLCAKVPGDATITAPVAIRYDDHEWFAVYHPGNGVDDVGYDSLDDLLIAHTL